MDNSYINDAYNDQSIEFKQKLTKTQSKTMTFSFLWSSFGFIVVGLLTFGYVYIFKTYFNDIFIYNYNTYLITSSIISLILLIVGIVLDMKIRSNLINASWGLIIGVWIIYVFIYTGILAPLITLINDPYVIMISLGITGLSLLMCSIISFTMMNDKIAYTINKIVWITFTIMLVLQLIFCFAWAFSYSGFRTWQLIYSIIFSIISFLLLLQNMYAIRKNSIFIDQTENRTITRLSFYFGYIIMCSVINLFIMLLRLMSNIKK